MNNRICYILGVSVLLAIALSIPFGSLQAQDDTDQEQQNIELIRQYYNEVNEKDFSVSFFSDYFASSSTWHEPDLPTTGLLNHSILTSAYSQLASAFPDYVWTVENIAAAGNVVIIHYSFFGTFESDWVPWGHNQSLCRATQNEVAWDGVFVYRLEDQLIVELWPYWDNPLVNDPEANCG